METKQEFKEKALTLYADAARGSSSRAAFLEALARRLQAEDERAKLPKIVCLCGSTRFYEQFQRANFEFTLKGYIVLSIGCDTKSDEAMYLTVEDKIKLDELHKRKIDLCDFIYVLDVDDYIGESTASEISYAAKLGKPIKLMSTGNSVPYWTSSINYVTGDRIIINGKITRILGTVGDDRNDNPDYEAFKDI